MRRRYLVLVALGLLAPVAVASPSVGAVQQDLVVSVTTGAPGTVVTVTSASCASDPEPEGNVFRYLSVRLISGTAPNEVLAGAASGDAESPARFVVPDWIDPDAPAVIEASCREADFTLVDPEDPDAVVVVDVPYDPVPFDVTDAVEPPVQERSFSRTSLLVGQSLEMDGSGCFLEGQGIVGVDVAVGGGDLTGRTWTEVVSGGGAVYIEGDAFSVEVILSDSGLFVSWGQVNGERPVPLQAGELPTDIPEGPAVAIPYCTTGDGAFLMFEPELLDLTGRAPIGDVDLTVPLGTRSVTMAGGSCTVGDVTGDLFGSDLIGEQGAVAGDVRAVRSEALVPSPLRTPSGPRAVPPDRLVTFGAVPDEDGSWAVDDEVTFDVGFVAGGAVCGDPLRDGWYYDDQIAIVNVAELPPTTTPTTTTTTVPGPAPAKAQSGTPTYAG